MARFGRREVSVNIEMTRQRGFTLIEVAIALLLIGILMGSVLGLTSTFRDLDKAAHQQISMDDIRAALITYLKINKFLPCPDMDNDGFQNRKTSKELEVCENRVGKLPYKDLGIPGKDEWDNTYYYRVNQRAESSTYINDVCQTTSVFGLDGQVTVPDDFGYCSSAGVYYCKDCSSACSTACSYGSATDVAGLKKPPYFRLFTPPVGVDTAGEGTNSHKNLWLADSSGNEIDNAMPFIVVSFGKNGAQTWRNCYLADAPERENCDDDIVFVVPDEKSENRDFMTYLNAYELKKALLESGAYQ